MTPSQTSKKMEKEFEQKFVTKSAFGVSIGAIDNLNETALNQVKNWLRIAFTTIAQEVRKEERERIGEKVAKLDIGDKSLKKEFNCCGYHDALNDVYKLLDCANIK